MNRAGQWTGAFVEPAFDEKLVDELGWLTKKLVNEPAFNETSVNEK
jgi:hypothetical protein